MPKAARRKTISLSWAELSRAMIDHDDSNKIFVQFQFCLGIFLFQFRYLKINSTIFGM